MKSLQFTVHHLQFTFVATTAINKRKLKTDKLMKTENGKLIIEATEGSIS